MTAATAEGVPGHDPVLADHSVSVAASSDDWGWQVVPDVVLPSQTESDTTPEWAVTLRQRREALGLTKQELAEYADVGRATIWGAELGRWTVTDRTRRRLDAALTELERWSGTSGTSPPGILSPILPPPVESVVVSPCPERKARWDYLERIERLAQAERTAQDVHGGAEEDLLWRRSLDHQVAVWDTGRAHAAAYAALHEALEVGARTSEAP